MTVESATYINELNSANPAGGDQKLEGDNHLRLIKSCLLNSFPYDLRALVGKSIRSGQTLKFDGSNLNVNVRSRYAKYASTAVLNLTHNTDSDLEFPDSAVDTFGFGYASPGKIILNANTLNLAYRFKGVVTITNPAPTGSFRVTITKGTNTIVLASNFFPGFKTTAETIYTVDIFDLLPQTLANADELFLNIRYVDSTASGVSLAAGASFELFDVG